MKKEFAVLHFLIPEGTWWNQPALHHRVAYSGTHFLNLVAISNERIFQQSSSRYEACLLFIQLKCCSIYRSA